MPRHTEAKHFFLNEQHELSRTEREGGGGLPKLGEINWKSKQRRLSRSLVQAKRAIDDSEDPLRGQRYFLLAKPERTVPKTTEDLRKSPSGKFDEEVDYAGKDSRVLGRLGLDVLRVMDLGAVVHASPERFEHLTSISSHLEDLGRMEQSRWAYIADFGVVPEEARADRKWLNSIGTTGRHEVIVELQPLLSRLESSLVFRTIAEGLRSIKGEGILGSGTDFSGRNWLRANLSPRTILAIVRKFFSVQAVHPPLLASIAAVPRGQSPHPGHRKQPAANARSTESLPVVAVVDSGVAKNHPVLERYRRGFFIHPQSAGVFDNHGTFVASRVVFGDTALPLDGEVPPADLRFVDVVVARDQASVDGKIVANAIETVAANFPDVRTFNLSFGDSVAMSLQPPVERGERLLLTQDLDNLIFARDLVVIIAAGNSEPGIAPTPAYADHWQDPSWRIGHWAAGFNSLKCGSFVREWTIAGGVADVPFAPSPFCKVGPGLTESPVPDFSAHGGNWDAHYKYGPALGVYGLTPSGLWEDRSGTSYAAPILSRECAFAISKLQQVCPPQSRPFAATIKAFLALTATRPRLAARFEEAASRTLGFGEASSSRLDEPSENEAIFVWQGILTNKTDIAHVIVPIPKTWLSTAGHPYCEIAVAWDTPVNAAFANLYGCRRIDVKLRTGPDAAAVRPSPGGHKWYPLRISRYGLKQVYEKGRLTDDLWVIDLSYEEMCDYPPTQSFTPEQRVSIAVRLFDAEGKSSPQESVQNHPMAASMTRLSATPIPARVPVAVKLLS